MGFWALFEFALKCLYVVAWPCLALGHPLCASIRAIETKSDYHTRKLVTYWILFSLISLFEHAFLKLLQRLPVWPHTKLAVVCWLVTRHFNGAVCVYKLVVRPCLSVDRETVINWFSRKKDSLRKGATVLAVVVKYVRDNGTEALEKLLASKSTSTNANPCCVVDGSKSAAAEVEKASEPCVSAEESKAAAEDGDGVNASIAERILAPVEVKRTTGSTGSSWEHPQIPAFFRESPTREVRKEPDTTLNPQLQGREHQPADEELKEKSQASKCELLHTSTPKSTGIPKAKQEKGSSLTVCSHKVDSHEANNYDRPKESVSDNGDSFNTITGEEKKLQVVPYVNLNNTWVVEFKQSKWWCKICNISCTSQGNMDGHLKGSKHLCRALKIIAVCGLSNWRCMICNIIRNSGVDMDCHLNGKKHLARAAEVDSPDILKTQTVVEFKESKWWCSICNISCGSHGSMDCHLKGTIHSSCARSMVAVFDPPEWRCTICNISTTNGEKMDCHLKGKKHLSAALVI